jgi:hypothetical protein
MKNHSQNLIAQTKKLKGERKSQQETIKQLTSKESLMDKETMTNPIETEKSPIVKTQTMEKEIDKDPNKILSTNISLEVSKDKDSKNKTQDTRICYRHPNYKSYRIIQQANQRRNQYEKLSKYLVILKRSSSVESYHFPNH